MNSVKCELCASCSTTTPSKRREDGVARVEAAGGVGDGGGVEGLAAAEVVALEKDFSVASHCHGCSFF